MAITHTVQTVVTDGAVRINTSKSVTPTAGTSLDESIPDSSTDLEVAVSIDTGSLKSFILSSDQDITIRTNSAGAPQEVLLPKAGKPIVWLEGMANVPISGDITAFFITNSSGSAANVKLLAGWDATP